MINLQKRPQKDALLEEKKLSLKKELRVLEIQIATSKSLAITYTITKKSVSEEKHILGELVRKVKIKEKELAVANTAIAKVEREENVISLTVREKENESKELSEGLSNKKKRLKELFSNIVKLEKRRSVLDGLGEQTETQKRLLRDINVAIKDSGKELQVLIDISLNLEKEEVRLNKELKRIEKKTADKAKGLTDREGDLSIREASVTKKEKRLKKLKRELEKYYNRKFPYIRI